MIPQHFIDELLRRVDIVEVVGQYVPLKRAGANYQGLCPFHTEKSPSFSVSPSKQFYHCFGCGAHGTAIGFLIEHLGLPFPQAVEDLARRAGLEVPRQAPAVDPEVRKHEMDLRSRLREVLLEAAKFYVRRLKDSPEAIAYLKGRGLSGEIAAQYKLGYAPEGWQPLQAVFGDYQNKDLVDAGLVIEGDGGKRYDRFRHRIMFPILSPRGEVVGFGARTMTQEEPKYLNSPETPVFSKGHELYGVFEARARIREVKQVWVVEGYMDVVALAQHGLGHAVATLGTATTPSHLQALLRLSDHVVFMFDGDNAGRRAAARALETAMPFASEKNRIDFVFLPAEHDPDSFVRERGAQALRDWVTKAKPLSAWLLDIAAEGQQLEFAEGRAAAASQAQRLLTAMPAGPLKSQVMREVVRAFDVPISTESASRQARPAPFAAAPRATRPVIRPLAERVLQILVRQPQWVAHVDQEFVGLLDPAQSELLSWLHDKRERGSGTSFAALHEAALAEGRDRGGETIRFFLRLAKPDQALDDLLEHQPDQLRMELDLAVTRLKIRSLEEQATQLAASAGADPSALASLQALRLRIQDLKALAAAAMEPKK